MKALSFAPDFDHTKPQSDTRILFVHRKLADTDIYFVDNRNERDETVDASFRVTGKLRSYGMRRPAKWSRLHTPSRTAEPRFPCILSHGERCSSCSAKHL